MSDHGSNSVNTEQLRAFIERIERINVDLDAMNDDKKEIYAEVKSVGYDARIVKKIVQLRRMDRDKRKEQEEILDLYLSVLGEL